MSPLTILRIEKLKTFGNVAGSDDHVTRNRETPNADPTRENVRLIGGEDSRALEEIVKEKIATLKHRPRHDAVLCTEMFLSASPEYFRPGNPSLSGQWSDERMQQWAIASRDWLTENYGSKCVRAELHLDESTPHIHAYIVPLNEKTGRVSHDAMFGGRGGQGRIKLSKLQDSYAAALAPLGIERGVKGSKATHTKVKEYYQAVNSEPLTAVITNNQLAPTPFESASSYVARIQSDEHFQAINHQLADRKFLIERLERAEQRARDSEKERQQLEKQVQLLSSQTQQLRDLPLEDVAWELGLNCDRTHQSRWKGHGHIINIDGPKFYDFAPDQQKGSGGAIDLVMHVNQCNLRQAVVWLHERFGSAGAERTAIAKAKIVAAEIIQLEPRTPFQLPVEDKAKWQAVSNYLIQKRGIPSNFVELLHKRGLVYADDQQNAVFVMRNLGLYPQAIGAFLRGTRGENNTFKGYEFGTKRREGWFYFHLGGQSTDPVEKVVLLKSPIDAISFVMLEYHVRGDVPPNRTKYMAVDNPKSLPVEQLQNIPNVQVAFDSDDEGNAAARVVKELLPQSKRLKCKADDWNQQLLDYGQQLRQQQQQQRQQDDELSL
ncbi:MobV family relaxase [Nostoc sp. 'Peltigera membranacea cyanobiont' 232]|uniref:MobV family relaxase n=1 Tax=Nostoc sp. 'Peltigera membranacea cyanobiont' 232 TaxID=2014531 RepID=UPI000B9506EE|nr:MobV family relaxase [Nostoc sp. 'Peltigera membranacea cyanobiont' 232]OYE01689.1 mobilization protein [Nostoc sp. 'Peltigera membranacea cyanobiont' 232]